MKSAPRISDAEWDVIKVVCRQAPCSAQDVIAAIAPGTGWSPATIKTMLNRLLRKKALRFEKVGKSYLYSPAFTEAEFRAAEAESFLERVFDGALSPLLSHFVQSRRLSEQEMDELSRLLRDERKRK